MRWVSFIESSLMELSPIKNQMVTRIIASMKRAVLTRPGVAEWYEMCLCPSPLYHERTTQYDFYFSEMTTEEVDDYGEVEGDSLWSYMASKTEGSGCTEMVMT